MDLPSGDTVDGKIASVGKVATSSSTEGEDAEQANDGTATIEVTVRLAKRTKALDQAPVTVNFEQSRRRDVLAIPVTALLARAGGRFAVEVRDGGVTPARARRARALRRRLRRDRPAPACGRGPR